MKRCWEKASFTIEASVIIPFALCLMIYVLQLGIQCYQESKDRSLTLELETWDAVSTFYKVQMFKALEEELKDDET